MEFKPRPSSLHRRLWLSFLVHSHYPTSIMTYIFDFPWFIRLLSYVQHSYRLLPVSSSNYPHERLMYRVLVTCNVSSPIYLPHRQLLPRSSMRHHYCVDVLSPFDSLARNDSEAHAADKCAEVSVCFQAASLYSSLLQQRWQWLDAICMYISFIS